MNRRLSIMEFWPKYRHAQGADGNHRTNLYLQPPHESTRFTWDSEDDVLISNLYTLIDVLLTTHPDWRTEVESLLAEHLDIDVSDLHEYWTRLLTFVSFVVRDSSYIQQSRAYRSAWRDLQKAEAWEKAAIKAMRAKISASSVHTSGSADAPARSRAALSAILSDTHARRIWALAQTSQEALSENASATAWSQMALDFLANHGLAEPVGRGGFRKSIKRELDRQYDFDKLTKDTFRSLVFSEAARHSVLVSAPVPSGK